MDEHKCYCVCWCGDDAEGKDFSTRGKRREYALEYVKQGKLQGYLAYQGERIVGWCNANTKAECLRCASWRRFMGNMPEEEPGDARVKSVFCFVIAPDLRRQGLARLLLERVCHDAAEEGFAYVEAYPWKELDFGGYYEMYQQSGFQCSWKQSTDMWCADRWDRTRWMENRTPCFRMGGRVLHIYHRSGS